MTIIWGVIEWNIFTCLSFSCPWSSIRWIFVSHHSCSPPVTTSCTLIHLNWSRSSRFDSTSSTHPAFCLDVRERSTETSSDVLFPVNVIPALIVFPRQYLCHLFLQRTYSKHVCLWSSIPGRTVIYSLNRAFALAGKKISEVPGRDRVSVIPWARRRLSGSPGGKNSWEENNVSMWMPVKCVSWWESLFSVRSRHNKQWLKAYKESMMVKR